MRWKAFVWPVNPNKRRELILTACHDKSVFKWMLVQFNACRSGRKFAAGKTLDQAWNLASSRQLKWWLCAVTREGVGQFTYNDFLQLLTDADSLARILNITLGSPKREPILATLLRIRYDYAGGRR